MAQAFFRFYTELKFFLPRDKTQTPLPHPFKDRASVKGMIESFDITPPVRVRPKQPPSLLPPSPHAAGDRA